MPQLSIETFVTQYFWLVVILFVFYNIVVNTIVPALASSLKLRKKLIDSEETKDNLEEPKTGEDRELGINVQHIMWTTPNLKQLYLSNVDWISKTRNNN